MLRITAAATVETVATPGVPVTAHSYQHRPVLANTVKACRSVQAIARVRLPPDKPRQWIGVAGAYDMHAAPSGTVINLRPSGIRTRQQAPRK